MHKYKVLETSISKIEISREDDSHIWEVVGGKELKRSKTNNWGVLYFDTFHDAHLEARKRMRNKIVEHKRALYLLLREQKEVRNLKETDIL